MPRGDELNERQERFCREYVKDFNAKQAYIRSGYAPKAAGVAGHKLLNKDKVRGRINELKAKQEERLDFEADWIRKEMRELHDEAKANLNGDIMAPHQLRSKLLENMGKICGMYQNNDIDGRTNIAFHIKTGGKKAGGSKK